MEITQKEASEAKQKNKESDAIGSLNAFIQKAKSDKANSDFNKSFDSILVFLFYEYTEGFHCKPDTVDDMINGLKYLMFRRRTE